MALREPPALRWLMNSLLNAIPTSEDAGICAAKEGYHNSRDDLPPSDYSVMEYSDDQLGDGSYASALDLTIRDQNVMNATTAKLRDAWLAQDPRLNNVRAFNGTTDGSNALRWDVSNGPPSSTSWTDDSHLWHVHLEVFRRYSNDMDTMRNILSVMVGQGTFTVTETQEDEVLQSDIDNIVKQVTQNVVSALCIGAWRDGYTSASFDKPYNSQQRPTLSDINASAVNRLDAIAARLSVIEKKMDK